MKIGQGIKEHKGERNREKDTKHGEKGRKKLVKEGTETENKKDEE